MAHRIKLSFPILNFIPYKQWSHLLICSGTNPRREQLKLQTTRIFAEIAEQWTTKFMYLVHILFADKHTLLKLSKWKCYIYTIPTSLDLYVTFHLYVNMSWLSNKHGFGINYLMLFQNAKAIIN